MSRLLTAFMFGVSSLNRTHPDNRVSPSKSYRRCWFDGRGGCPSRLGLFGLPNGQSNEGVQGTALVRVEGRTAPRGAWGNAPAQRPPFTTGHLG